MGKKLSKECFVERSNIIHENKYDYSKVEYINSSTKVCIICPEHGEFWQSPNKHMSGRGCPKCAENLRNKKKSFTYQIFEKKSNKIHNGKYLYHQDYKNYSTKVKITCPIHGDFYQSPNHHLCGQGCPKCGIEKIHNVQRFNIENFIEKARKVHGDKYDYNKSVYVNYKTPILIICHKKGNNNIEHGEFFQTPDAHLNGHGCPKCGNQLSNGEEEIINFFEKECKIRCVIHDKTIIPPYELDIYIPEKKIAIEYDGLIWHSEKFGKDKNYHLNKTELCEKQGIRLIHIFEDEWLYKQNIIKEKLKYITKCAYKKPKIYARQCNISEIDRQTAKLFLDNNHIQGYGSGSVYLGCFYKNDLVGVMVFKRERKDSNKWELIRFANVNNKICVGTASKLFKYFITHYEYNEIKSFADRRWSSLLENNLYNKLGFSLKSVLQPDYSYIDESGHRFHKFLCRKNRLIKKYPNKGLMNSMTETEMCKILKFYKIWNCGLLKYVYINQDK